MNQHVIDLLSSWAQKLSSTIVKVSPVVWKTTVAVKQADCLGNLITVAVAAAVHIVIILALAVALARVFKYMFRDANNWDTAKDWWGLLFVIGALIFSGINVADCWFDINGTLLDQWQWIGVAHPGLAVAHDIIQKVMGN